MQRQLINNYCRVIKVEVLFISRSLRLPLITLTSNLHNCFIILWTKEKKCKSYFYFTDCKQHQARKLDMITFRNHAPQSHIVWLPVTSSDLHDNDGNRTEWSPIPSVRVNNKIGQPRILKWLAHVTVRLQPNRLTRSVRLQLCRLIRASSLCTNHIWGNCNCYD